MAFQGQFDDFTPYTNCTSTGRQQPSRQYNNPPVAQMGKTNISNLSAGTSATIVGVVINREEPRHVPSKKDPGSDRQVMSMTVRDSPADFINATCWGSMKHINELASLIHIGDVVQITNALVQCKPTDGTDEKFRPWTPSLYQLTLSEHRTTVALYHGYDSQMYLQLSHIPVKPSNEYFTLSEVISNGENIGGELINLLAVVKSVGAVKEITTKTGKKTKRCEVKLWDETYPSLALTLWDSELTDLTQTWTPMYNVLFIADVKVNFDNFRKTMVATATGKTIITVNPDTQDAHNLYSMAQSADVVVDDDRTSMSFHINSDNDIDLSSIDQVYRMCELEEKLEAPPVASGDNTEYCIVYAFVSHLDLDGSLDNCILIKCGKCRQRVDSEVGMCMKQNCPVGASMGAGDGGQLDTQYNLRLSLTDHTGTLHGVFLMSDAASSMLNCSVSDFLAMDENSRTNLKWQFLFEKCKVYLKIILPTFEKRKCFLKVLSCERANLHEAVRFLH